MKVTPRKLKGFQDLISNHAWTKEKIIQTIKEVGSRAMFSLVETPTLEYSEVLLGVGGETDKQVFRFEDNGGRDVALRFDLTVPFARLVAETMGKLPIPYKRMQIGQVFRAEKPQKGRYREFGQCDLDIIGGEPRFCDLELIATLVLAVDRVLQRPLTVRVGHRTFVSALIQAMNAKEVDEAAILIQIDKLGKIGAEKVVESLNQLGFERSKELIDVLTHADPLAEASNYISDNSVREDIQFLMTSLQGVGQYVKVVFDPSIVRGLGYYTGVVFEMFIDELDQFGSICSGGRYAKLVNRFSKTEIEGVGGSVGSDRLLAALDHLGALDATPAARVVITCVNSSIFPYAFDLVSRLRDSGQLADLFLKDQKLSHQMKWANKSGAPFCVVLGEEEMKSGTYSLKNMETHEEIKELSFAELLKGLG